MFSTFDCALMQIRQKEDPWNAIMSGALTGGFLAARGGLSMSLRSALVGGIFLALIEGAALGMNRMFAEQYRPPQQMNYA
jgi:import inner membrane translocase subunit TIM17